uniref:Synaptonemal complex protein 2 Spt16M-like domain-containing protein n=3 Tax=Clytia hemisphaerica TaxID=252671 RepID=A0A7M5UJ09_9CNID
MEAIFRLISPEDKEKFASYWFSSKNIQNSFLSIRNEEFETDGRRFLNYFNNSAADSQRVFSFPALVVSLGRYQLKQPRDSKVTDFWVDFNVASRSISTFVNDDTNTDTESSDWEMIIIKKEDIRDFRVNVNEEKTIVILKLFEPAYQLAPFCPEANENYVKITFPRKLNGAVSKALGKLFGEVKYVELPISSPSISSTPGGRNLRTSMAISPLAVHGCSTSTNKKKTLTCAISDSTVSSSSGYAEDTGTVVGEEKEEHDNEEKTNEDECERKKDEEEKEESEHEETVQDEKASAEFPPLLQEAAEEANDEKPPAPKDGCPDNHFVPETQEKKTNNEEEEEAKEEIHFEVEQKELPDREEKDLVFEETPIDSDEEEVKIREEVKIEKEVKQAPRSKAKPKKTKPASSRQKKGKKLMKTNNYVMFQDSPDENYEAAPVKTFEEQQKKKEKLQAAKTKKTIGKVKDVQSLAIYDFDDMNDEKELDEETKEVERIEEDEKPNSKKKNDTKATRQKKKKPPVEDEASPVPQTTTSSRRSSRRRKEKEVNYQEPSTSDIDDFKDQSSIAGDQIVGDDEEVDQNSDKQSFYDVVPVEEEKPVISKKKKSTNHKRKESMDRKSVSFVSPIVDPLDQHHSPLDNLITKSVLKHQSDEQMTSSQHDEIPLTPLDGPGDADVIAFQNAMLKEEKMNRVRQWSEKVSAKCKTSFDADLTSTPIDNTSKHDTNEHKSNRPKPFERNIQLGWGLKGTKKSSTTQQQDSNHENNDDSIYDFHDEIDVADDEDRRRVADTPWSAQKKKKEKVKKKYTKKENKIDSDVKKFRKDDLDVSLSDDGEAEGSVVIETKKTTRRKGIKNRKIDINDSINNENEVEVEATETKPKGRSTRGRGKRTHNEEEEELSQVIETKQKRRPGRPKKTTNTDDNSSRNKNSRNALMKKTKVEKSHDASLASIVASFDDNHGSHDDELEQEQNEISAIQSQDFETRESPTSNQPQEESSPEVSINEHSPLPKISAKRFYGKLDISEHKSGKSLNKKVDSKLEKSPVRIESKSRLQVEDEMTPVQTKPNKKPSRKPGPEFESPAEPISKKSKLSSKTETFVASLLKESQNTIVSSLEGSQEIQQDFMDTPMCADETPMCEQKQTLYKNWVQQLNEKLENIEAVTNKKQSKRKLWKSPVVVMTEDETADSPVVEKRTRSHQKKDMKRTRQQQQATASTSTTPLQQKPRHLQQQNNASKLIQTPDIGLCEGVDAFAKFCQSMLNKNSPPQQDMEEREREEDVDQSATTMLSQSYVTESQPEAVPKSPPKKKNKVEVEPNKALPRPTSKLAESSKRKAEKISPKDATNYLQLGDDTLQHSKAKRSMKYETSEDEEDEEYEADVSDDVTTPMTSCFNHRPFDNNNMEMFNLSFGQDHDMSGVEGNEIQGLLHMFGKNVSKSINTKKQATELFVNNVMKIVSKKVKTFCTKQSKTREIKDETYHNQFLNKFDDWYQMRIQKDDKIQKCIDQLKQVVKNQNDEDKLRIKKLRQSYTEGYEERRQQMMEDSSAQDNLQLQIRGEIKKLKKQMLQQSKASEVANIRRSLQTMLNKV